MKIGFFPHSDNPVYAGVRLRCLLPIAALRAAGHEARLAQAKDDFRYYDAVVVQAKWLLDATFAAKLQERADRLREIKASGTRLFLDSFDNYFLNSKTDLARSELLQVYRKALPLFDRFLVSSSGLKPLLSDELWPDASVNVIGDPLEGPDSNKLYEPVWMRWNPRRWNGFFHQQKLLIAVRRRRKIERQLMWFGNHGSAYATGGMSELEMILPGLQDASETHPLRLTVVSNSREKFETITAKCRFECNYMEWDRLSFTQLLQEQDLVLLPARINTFTIAKSNNRLLLPLSLGVPVMASGLPDYLPWRDYCAIDEWEHLPTFLQDPSLLRLRLSRLQPDLLQRFSIEAIGQEWVATLES